MSEEREPVDKSTIINTISDTVSNFMYYDRKNNDVLRIGEIEQAVIDGVITVDEIVKAFENELRDYLNQL